MSREIKFRGKRLDNGEWVYGDLTHGFSQHHTFIDDQEVLSDTVGQYTGLHDKNGREIYEGDVLEYDFYYFEGINNGATGFAEWRRQAAEVCFVDGCFTVDEQLIIWLADAEEDTDYEFEPDYEKGLKVIGNIHENSELLQPIRKEENV